MTYILAVGDSIRLQTGYGRVSQHVLGYFVSKGHTVNQIGWGHFEPPENVRIADHKDNQIGVIGLFPPYTRDQFATESTINWIEREKPDMVYNSNDFFTSKPLVKRRKDVKQPFFLVNYGVIDAVGSADSYKEIIDGINVPVTPSKFGFEQLKKVSDRAMYIPHGVDLELYHPILPEERQTLREKYGLQNKFVYGIVNRNIVRKQIPLIYQSFANLKNVHGLKDIVLLAITDPYDTSGYNLMDWAKKYNLDWSWNWAPASVMYHPQHMNYIMSLSEPELSQAYRLFDVMVSSTMSEGFGLSTLESAACGTPSIMPNHSANIELVEGHGWLTKTLKMSNNVDAIISSNQAEVEYGYPFPDQYDIEMAMLDAYNNREKLADYSKKGVEFAKDYDWFKVLPLWDQVLEKHAMWKSVISK